ncbi:MAG: hypothetical protein ACR2QB_05570 [Gammaproteobacteria bacterium]
MKSVIKFSIALLVLLTFGLAVAGLHSEGDGLPKGNAGDGHCMHSLQNLMMDESVKSCESPASVEGCKTIGGTDDNSNAVHGAGDCPTEGALATCDTGDVKFVYYSDDGQLGGLEIGCGFQGGDWITP